MKAVWIWVGAIGLTLIPQAHASGERTVRVSGQCHRDVVPDRGVITVTVDVLEKDLNDSNRRATRTYEKVKSDVERLRLKDVKIETSVYQVQEQKEWEKERTVSKGFRTLLGLRVETSETARLGEVIQIAAREQVKNVGELSFFPSRELYEKTRLDCLKEASEHARTKANRLAESLGARVGRVLQIDEAPGATAPVQPMFESVGMMKAAAADRAAAPSIAVGKEQLDLSVNVVFGLD